jgi:hypothetical protein
MEEIVTNLHMHTTYSDGTGSHGDIAAAALAAGLDVVFTTDHNVLVKEYSRYYQEDGRKLLMITAEEVHDRTLTLQKNHLLVIGVDRELSNFAPDTQNLVNQVSRNNGVCFIAHPFEDAMPAFNETAITWERWDVDGYTGIEIWNGLSELKTRAKSLLQAGLYAFVPELMAKGPNLDALKKWDELTRTGKRLVAVGGSDAHNLKIHKGPIRRTIFPYEFHFRSVNTHLLLPAPLSGDITQDLRTLLNAFRSGHAYVGYDLPASTRGFRFTAQGRDQNVIMGDEISLNSGVTFQIRLPFSNTCRLIKDGEVFKTYEGRDIYTQIINQPGVYRVESYINFLNEERGWIFSNPIYVRDSASRNASYASQ